jgi:hypothetical protein
MLRVQGEELQILDSGIRVQGFEFKVQGLGFGV